MLGYVVGEDITDLVAEPAPPIGDSFEERDAVIGRKKGRACFLTIGQAGDVPTTVIG